MFDTGLFVPDIVSERYGEKEKFRLIREYLYELNEMLSFSLGDLSDGVSRNSESIRLVASGKTDTLRDSDAVDFGNAVIKAGEGFVVHSNKSIARVYPSAEICFLSLVIDVSENVSAGEKIIIARCSAAPLGFTPLCVWVGEDSGTASCGIRPKSGEIIMVSDTEIDRNKKIYISGYFYIR